jgi:hypothetical protein
MSKEISKNGSSLSVNVEHLKHLVLVQKVPSKIFSSQVFGSLVLLFFSPS